MEDFELTKKPDLGIFDQHFPARLKEADIFDPTKFTILTGSDGILDDLFSYRVYNYIKNHWWAAAAPADIQQGMIWANSTNSKLFLHGAADEEILQLTRSANVSPYFANLYLTEYIYHTGDLDTYIRFELDTITLRAGGIDFIKLVEAGTDYLALLAGKVFIGDIANANMVLGLTINQGAADNEILAFKSSDVAHGITTQLETDTYGCLRKVGDDDGGVGLWGATEQIAGVWLRAMSTVDDDTKSNAGIAPILIDATKKTGTTIGSVGANANLVAIRNSNLTRWIVDEDGDTWQAGNICIEGGVILSTIAGAGVITLGSGGNDAILNGAGNLNLIAVGGTGNVVLSAPASGAPACDTMVNNSVTFELDETGNNLYFKVQYSTGAAKSGSIAVA